MRGKMTTKLSPTTKDVALLSQLYESGQLKLQPEFQRDSVWPKAAKAYLIDTILNQRPIPLFFFQRTRSLQSGHPEYAVVDGQQRLRAVFEFINNRFPLAQQTDSIAKKWVGKKYSELPADLQDRILNYDLVVQELSGYSNKDIRDIFVRMNKYVVKLSKQELRHAKQQGKFKDFVERLAKWKVWKDQKVFSAKQLARMRGAEFAAELAILLMEGPQDKKHAIDLYYGQYRDSFPEGPSIESKLRSYIDWILQVLPDLASSRYRRSNELYSVIGAIDRISKGGSRLNQLDQDLAQKRLIDFETKTRRKNLAGEAARYVLASSKHADDLGPRNARIEILESLLSHN